MAHAFPKAVFKVVKPRRLYEQIAEQIAALISSEQFKPGDRLPPERELSVQFGVSRPSVREALIALEANGLVQVKQGDGAFVRAKAEEEPVLHWQEDEDPGPGPLEQLEARLLIEPYVASLAAKNGSDEELNELGKILDGMREIDPNSDLALEIRYRFHVALARMSGNSFLATAVKELWDLRTKEMWRTLRGWKPEPVPRNRSVEVRDKILTALRERDPQAARLAMKKMIKDVQAMYFDTQKK